MNKLTFFLINHVINYLDKGEKGIIDLVSNNYKYNYKLDIDGFILNEKMREWFCNNFNFNLDIIDNDWIMKKGKLNCLIYWYNKQKKKFKDDNYITCEPAFFNHKHIIEFLLEQDCQLNEWTAICATWGSNLELLKWLIEKKKCSWNSKIYFYANVYNCDKKIIKYAYESGCPYTDDIYYKVISPIVFANNP